METFEVSQHDYDGNFLPSLNLLGGKYTLDINMNDEDKLYQVVLTRWQKPLDPESDDVQPGDYVLLTNLGKKDNYKESLVSFIECAGNINDKNVEEIFLQHYEEKRCTDFYLLMDKAISNGLLEIIDDGGGCRPTQKGLRLVGLKTFKGLSQETAMKKIVEILGSSENEEYGSESCAKRYTYLPLADDNGKKFYGICINGRPSPERIKFDTAKEAKKYIRGKNT